MTGLVNRVLLLTILGCAAGYKINRVWPDKETVDSELVQQLNGSVIRPGDDQYYSMIMQKNLDFVRRPGAIVLVANRGKVIYLLLIEVFIKITSY